MSPPKKKTRHQAEKRAAPAAPRREDVMPDNKPQAYTSTATTTAPEELLYPAGKQPTAFPHRQPGARLDAATGAGP